MNMIKRMLLSAGVLVMALGSTSLITTAASASTTPLHQVCPDNQRKCPPKPAHLIKQTVFIKVSPTGAETTPCDVFVGEQLTATGYIYLTAHVTTVTEVVTSVKPGLHGLSIITLGGSQLPRNEVVDFTVTWPQLIP